MDNITAVDWLYERFKDGTLIEKSFQIAREMQKKQAPSWENFCECENTTGTVSCCDECGLPFEDLL